MKKIMIILVCLLTVILTSCGPKKVETPPEVNPPISQENNKPEENTPPKAFEFAEIEDFFLQEEKNIIDIFGNPQEENVYDFYDDKAKDMIYDDGSTFSVLETMNQSGDVFRGLVKNNKIKHPRDIKIGDSLENVLSRFPSESDGTKTKDEEDSSHEYEVVYGEYIHMSSFGVLEYRNGKPFVLTVSDQNLALAIEFENEKVSAIEYIIATD